MKKIFINDSLFLDQANKPDHQKRVNELAKIRASRKLKLLAAFKLVRDARNKNFSEDEWLPEFTHPLDLFNNISDTIPAGDPDDPEASNIEDLNRQINHYRAEYDTKVEQLEAVNNDLARYKRLVDEANEKLRSAIPSTNLDRTAIRTGISLPSSLPEYKGNFKLDAKTPVFHSRLDEDIESWIIRIEASLTLANVPVELWITACYNYVEGIALQMVIAAKKDNRTWNEFKDMLVKTFRPIFKDYDIRARLLKLKDVDSFDKYLHDFRSLTNQIPLDKLGKEDRLTLFMSGLRPKTRNELLQKKVKTLDEAIDLANSMNSARNMEKTSYGQINYAKSRSGKYKPKSGATSKKCHRCGKIGHLKAKCRVKDHGARMGRIIL
jgi:hypothetical protein